MALGEALHGCIERPDVLILERLEHAAEVPWRAHQSGTPAPLPPEERRALEEMHARARAESR